MSLKAIKWLFCKMGWHWGIGKCPRCGSPLCGDCGKHLIFYVVREVEGFDNLFTLGGFGDGSPVAGYTTADSCKEAKEEKKWADTLIEDRRLHFPFL